MDQKPGYFRVDRQNLRCGRRGGMELSIAFMTRPGHQSVVRRRSYTLVQQAFAANGINFAQPTVQVGNDEKQAAAAAANVISPAQQKAAQTAHE
jgi:moderate conductance mechanosensitive channel